jgi:hypothetical protein
LKKIGCYLIGTHDHGLTLKPNDDLGIKMFASVDFAGMHGYEDPEDPTSVPSRTNFVICIAKCPVPWISRLQTETACSTMHAEHIALSMAMRNLIPSQACVRSHMGLLDEKVAVIKTKTVVHEDSSGALTLAKLEPGQSTPAPKLEVPWLVPGTTKAKTT